MDLGKYASTVLSAYAVSIVLLGVLLAVTLWQGATTKRRLAQIEGRLAQGD